MFVFQVKFVDLALVILRGGNSSFSGVEERQNSWSWFCHLKQACSCEEMNSINLQSIAGSCHCVFRWLSNPGYPIFAHLAKNT